MSSSESSSRTPLIGVAVGNTRTRLGRFDGDDLSQTSWVLTSDVPAVVAAIAELVGEDHNIPVVLSSVDGSAARAISQLLLERIGVETLYIQSDIIVPMLHALDDASTLGQDRVLCAFAAFKRVKQACVVIDAGTAVTVDFVDGEGTFQGGAIAPGMAMMLKSLHEHTSALPEVEFALPDVARGVYGKDTRHAMVLGVKAGVIGLVHYLINEYANAYGAYPQIVATGGDAVALFEHDDLVEHVIPDLQLIGILEAVKAHDSDSLEEPVPEPEE